MACLDKSEDEILGFLESVDSSIDNGAANSKADEDISCLDEDMLLLNSPPPASSAPRTDDLQPASQSKSPAMKAGVKPTVPHVHGISDMIDDELEIIDDDEEVTHFNLDGSNSFSNSFTDEGESEDFEDEDELDEDDDDFDDDEGDELTDESEVESEGSTTFMDGKICIFFCHGSFLLWNTEDVQMLREECRIVGKLVGSLPRAPRQNSHLGLPLQLMPEEAKLLVDIDAAVVVKEEPVSYRTLAAREAAFENVRASNHKIQQKLYKDVRKEDVKKRMNEIIAGKKAKKRKLKEDCENGQVSTSSQNNKSKKKQAAKKSKIASFRDKDLQESKDEKEGDSDDKLTVDDIISETLDTSEKHLLVQIFSENPWKRNLHPYVEWTYPSTERETLRYLVFKDLWGRGFYLTSGAKFGGDFLVYPGDPARFHSHYIAICKTQLEDLPCLDIVSYGRQASNVRKTALLCSVDRNKKVFYTSLQWTGLS